MITAEQIRAARAMLKWGQKELAELAETTQTHIAHIESEKVSPTVDMMIRIQNALEHEGITFTSYGVEKRTDVFTSYQYKGEDWYLDLLDDVLLTLKNAPEEEKELLVDNGLEEISPPEVIEKKREIIKAGIRVRLFTEQDNTYIMGNLEDYRYIPKEYFFNTTITTFGDKVAIEHGERKDGAIGGTSCTVFHDKYLARMFRNKFNWLWSLSEQPTKTTARELY